MAIRRPLLDIADDWDPHGSLSSSSQKLLRGAKEYLEPHIPAGYDIKGSGGQGKVTFSPWIAILNLDETDTPQKGIYIVYLFAQDMATVTLSLNQGTTDVVEANMQKAGRSYARAILKDRAAAIRGLLPDRAVSGLAQELDLRSRGERQIDYENGHILGIPYDLDSLPDEQQLQDDLHRMRRLYESVLEIKARKPGATTHAGSPLWSQPIYELNDSLIFTRPKDADDAEYVGVAERRFVRRPRHNRLVTQFGEWAETKGFEVGTNVYPRDLVLRKGGQEWLIEAEVIRDGNIAPSAREAIGQLFEYRHRHYLNQSEQPSMVALFSEPLDEFYVGVLEAASIAVVWKSLDGYWVGSPLALTQDLPATNGS